MYNDTPWQTLESIESEERALNIEVQELVRAAMLGGVVGGFIAIVVMMIYRGEE